MSVQNTQITTSASNIYVSSGNTVVSVMYFCNTGASAVNLNVFLMPAAVAGSVTTTAYQIYSNIQLASNDTYVTEWEKVVLGNGDVIKANCTANSAVTATVSYVGI